MVLRLTACRHGEGWMDSAHIMVQAVALHDFQKAIRMPIYKIKNIQKMHTFCINKLAKTSCKIHIARFMI